MIDQDKPRICQVLGVEASERATYTDPQYGEIEFEIEPDGNISFIYKNGMQAGQIGIGYAIIQLINHPDRIIRKPRFSEEERAQAGAMEILFGAGVSIHRDESGLLYVRNAPENYHIPIGLFPSLRPGQSIALEEIVG